MKKFKMKNWSNYIFLLFPLIVFFLVKFDQNDIWFLLSHGRYVLSKGFPHIEFLTMHSGLHFVMQQWLSSVIFYNIFNIFGFFGLYIFLFLLTILLIYLLYKLCLIISNDNKLSSSIFTSITVILLLLGYITPRPQVFSYINFVILLILLELYIKDKKDLLFLLPVISILQINLHASMWPVYFVLMMPFVAELLIDLIKNKNKKINKLLIIILISILVGFINPYGIENMTYAFNSYGNKYINIIVSEMRQFNLSTTSRNIYAALLFLSLFFFINLLLFVGRKKIKIHEILLIYGTFFMSFLNLRNYGLLYLCSFPIVSKCIDIDFNIKDSIVKLIYILLLSILLIVFIYSLVNKKYIINNYNKKLINYLDKNENKNIKIFTYYDDGGIYEFYGYKPYIDPRAEVFTKKLNKKEDIITEYYYFDLDDTKYFKEFDKKYKFDYYVVMNYKTTLIMQLEMNNFKRVAISGNRYLYKRS